jgi:hypothetical protein
VNTVLITEKQARMGGKKVNTVLAIKPLPLGQNFGDSSICHTDGASLKTGTRRRRRRCYAHGELFISNCSFMGLFMWPAWERGSQKSTPNRVLVREGLSLEFLRLPLNS